MWVTCKYVKTLKTLYLSFHNLDIFRSWSSNTNLANIRNDADNKIIASLLRSSGVNEAWIGIYDPSKSSTSYGSVEPHPALGGKTGKVSNIHHGKMVSLTILLTKTPSE